jgi:hypothetical protein
MLYGLWKAYTEGVEIHERALDYFRRDDPPHAMALLRAKRVAAAERRELLTYLHTTPLLALLGECAALGDGYPKNAVYSFLNTERLLALVFSTCNQQEDLLDLMAFRVQNPQETFLAVHWPMALLEQLHSEFAARRRLMLALGLHSKGSVLASLPRELLLKIIAWL